MIPPEDSIDELGEFLEAALLEADQAIRRELAAGRPPPRGRPGEAATSSRPALDPMYHRILRHLPQARALREMPPHGPTASGRPESVPSRIGRFRIVERIGAGGFGIVYLAVDEADGREVALKVARPEVLRSAASLRRFVNEARAAAQLEHPGIVPVYEAGGDGSLNYIVYEYQSGPTLADWLRRRADAVPPQLAAGLLAALADAVQHSHDRGILHRDLKPENVLLESVDGSTTGPGADATGLAPRITDFGLAKQTDEVGDATQSGALLGTPAYMAPEQAAGRVRDLSPATDVYGLGTILYAVLTGGPPFRGETRQETIQQVLGTEPTAPRALRPGLPRALETICLKCLEKSPARRYQSSAELAEDLRRFLAGGSIVARPPSALRRARRWARRHSRLATLTAGSVVVGLMAFTALVAANLWLRGHNLRLEEARARAERSARVADQHRTAAEMRVAHDALASEQVERAQDVIDAIRPGANGFDPRGFAWRLLRWLSRRQIAPLRGHEAEVVSIDVSPDGRSLVSSDTQGVGILWDLAQARPMKVLAGFHYRPGYVLGGRLILTWEAGPTAPTRGVVVLDGRTGERLCRIDTGDARGLFMPPGNRLQASPYCMYYTAPVPQSSAPSLVVWSLAPEPRQPRRLYTIDRVRGAHLSGNCQFMAITTEDNQSTLRDPATGSVLFSFPHTVQAPVWAIGRSRDGWLLAVEHQDRHLAVWDARQGKRDALHDLGTDSKNLVIEELGGGSHALLNFYGPWRALAVMDLGTGHIEELIPHAQEKASIMTAVSPNSDRVAAAFRDQDARNWTITVWDVKPLRQVKNTSVRDETRGLAFTSDGRSLVYAARNTIRLWRFDRDSPDDVRSFKAHQDEAWTVAFSPDGTRLATGSNDTDERRTLKLWDRATGKEFLGGKGHRGTVSALAFSPDGRLLASGALCKQANVKLWDPATGQLVATLSGHSGRVRTVGFSPDGRLLASAGDDQVIRLWETATHQCVRTLSGHSGRVRQVAFSPDGLSLVSASDDRTARLWELSTGGARFVWHGPGDMAGATFAPDGLAVATANRGGMINLWEVATGRRLRTIETLDDTPRCVAFSPDGLSLIMGGDRGTVRVWDRESTHELLVLDGPEVRVNSLALSPEGNALAAAYHNGIVQIWRADP